MRRIAPRRLATALEEVAASSAPATTLARVQGAWSEAVGERIAAQADPVSEREGAVTVACRSGAWAQELELLEAELREQLNRALGAHAGEPTVTRLRFAAGAATGSRGPSPGRRRGSPRRGPQRRA